MLSTEGELETEWLQAAGLGSLAAPFQAGLEVTEAQLGEAVRPLPREQAAAVRRRVRRLNRTVRKRRAASRARKPDIRDVDSYPADTHSPVARTPSAPASRRVRLSPPAPALHSPPRAVHELFKPNDLHWADIASNTVSRTKSAVATPQPLSFEHKFNLDRQMLNNDEDWPEADSTVDIESVGESQLKKLTPLLWLQLTALFDKYSLPFHKRKSPKKKRKEEGAVFGVALETLLRKDMILWEETWSSVPAILRTISSSLRTKTMDEGLLRVPGNKHKLIERHWYSDRSDVEAALARASGHDLAAVFKRLLRSLPQPPLTQELMRLFYQTYSLSGSTQGLALNLLVLLLPAEQRATLREVLRLVAAITEHSHANKMSDHNVAMIIAPALFPPSLLIKSSDSLETQLATAANSCHVTEALMRWSDQLWKVPASLLAAAQRKPHQLRRNNHT
ncbi:unnamed protein product [Leptidea sinapis]|uniref:Rho-GAP domain-containing protein n=1 Tax=Leptidea sinapis TaxID=189913 RepID=A0A5E4QVT3_9NEOP|nr:unnamed protein product [Leptidea sinapis]